jgi:hypothetical protein
MPGKRIVHLPFIRNSIIRAESFPAQWKVAQIIMIPKPGKPLEEVGSYRPISLLIIMRKIFEKAVLKRLRPIFEKNQILPGHQFEFRQQHSTIKQVYRITQIISGKSERKKEKTVLLCSVSKYHKSV